MASKLITYFVFKIKSETMKNSVSPFRFGSRVIRIVCHCMFIFERYFAEGSTIWRIN